MKVTTFFLLAFALHVSGRGIGQDKLTFKFKKTEIAGILSHIEKETNYRFLYNEQLHSLRRKITLSVEEVDIKQALDRVFASTALIYQFMENNLIVVRENGVEVAQPKPITGKVTDEEGKPLVGVSVNIKGTSTGTVTDEKGEFTINAEESDVLTLSYVGYVAQEIKIGGTNTFSVSLVSVKKYLDAVVVIGYGSVKKRDLTGSVISVKGDEIKKVPAANVMESLQGKLPGADITRMSGSASSGVNIVIRGNRSLTAGNGPLFIVDGVQYPGSMDINPNDVQSMEVLKDASSTAVYGSRGANGVILITTKKGSTGKPRVSFNSYYGASDLSGYPRYMNSQEYRDMRREANRRITLAGINTGGTWNSPADDGTIFNNAELTNLQNNVYTDYNNEIFTHGSMQEYQVGVSAGSEKTKVYLSLGYFREAGILKNDNLERYTGRLNVEQSLGRIAKTGMQFQFTNFKTNTRTNPLDEASKVSPFSEAFDASGNIILTPMGEAARWNPLVDDQPYIYADNNTATNRTLGIAFVEIMPFKGFTARSNFGVVFNNAVLRGFNESNSLMRRGQGPLASYTANKGTDITWENILTYTKTAGNHTFGVTGVTSFLQFQSETVSAQGQNQILPTQLYYGLGNAPDGVLIASGYSKNNLISYTGRVNYSFKGKYLLSATIRTDGSSKLGDGNKWDYFPSVAAAWRISDEAFLANSKTVSDLKLRLSYGVSGNDAISPYQTQTALQRIPNSFGDASALAFAFSPILGNTGIGWEKTKVTNLGVDFGLFDQRVSGSVDYYYTHTEDLLMSRSLTPTSGFTSTTENIGSTKNNGIDINLNVAIIRKADMSLNAGITFFSNRERIATLATGNDDIANGWFIGYPVSVFFDYQKIGIWQMADSAEAKLNNQKPGDIRVADRNNDKMITPADRMIVGQQVPKWNGGLNLDFRYKGFDLNAFFFARMGQMMNYNYYTRVHLAARESGAVVNYWTPENPSNDFPHPRSTVAGVTNLLYGSTLAYTDASFIKLRNLTIGYTLPKSLVSKVGMSNVRVYVTGKNIWTVYSELNDYDVEQNGALTSPFTKLFMAGISVDF